MHIGDGLFLDRRGRLLRFLHLFSRDAVFIVPLVVLLVLLLQVPKDVIQHKVPVGLLGEEERLRKLSPWSGSVGDLANHLENDSARKGGLGVDVVNKGFAVGEAERDDSLVDLLRGRA